MTVALVPVFAELLYASSIPNFDTGHSRNAGLHIIVRQWILLTPRALDGETVDGTGQNCFITLPYNCTLLGHQVPRYYLGCRLFLARKRVIILQLSSVFARIAFRNQHGKKNTQHRKCQPRGAHAATTPPRSWRPGYGNPTSKLAPLGLVIAYLLRPEYLDKRPSRSSRFHPEPRTMHKLPQGSYSRCLAVRKGHINVPLGEGVASYWFRARDRSQRRAAAVLRGPLRSLRL